MPSSVFHKLYYHVVWTTKGRMPAITPAAREELLKAVRSKCASLGCHMHAVNAVEDHVHLVVEIRPALPVSQVIGQIKGASSHEVNQLGPFGLGWQDGYGVVSLREADLARVIRYVETQQARHSTGRLSSLLEQVEPALKDGSGT